MAGLAVWLQLQFPGLFLVCLFACFKEAFNFYSSCS